ncbi:MAG: 50S ribosomal protein L1 [Candidatus Nanoarchaeia archaeon]|nr:50S ribosomal protein L1 [Candidatus Haiyanarchaeum thermophilum]MCW1302829.1 50S ribosomal protein L1 [Candidatus Haiyanarchaeum thermophilum]MCW1303510.1 50S ribosomal protein L1 [Candidatus Haiyanarchaeum thermophilum]MCW1306690.1 50S ribosomal protein L1 [Candidatus Haiyanarchaeum thermophilum]MCW1307354.1 50S ribosomal protein L1 [Candidatus Haiyanarchaeum thermophilum]
MDKESFLDAIKKLRAASRKRKFTQSFDLIISLKDFDPKKPENNIQEYLVLPHGVGKEIKICGIVDKELETEAKKYLDLVITKNDLEKYAQSPKEAKKLCKRFDFFLAQANLMPRVGQIFGKYLSSRGKMPNPKFSGILSPTSKLNEIVERLRKTVRISNNKQNVIQCRVGCEKMSDEEIAENCIAVYNFVVKRVPRGKQQIKSCLLKLTMSSPVEVKESGNS